MKKMVKYVCILLCLSLLLSACGNKETTENDPADVGVQAAIALVDEDIDAFYGLFLPDMFSNASALYQYEIRTYLTNVADWIASNCEIELYSAKIYTADKNDNDGFLSFSEYFAADESSLRNPDDFLSNFAGSFFYNYAWELLSLLEYSGDVEEIAVCGFNMTDRGEPDIFAIILGKVNNQWYVITLLDN